ETSSDFLNRALRLVFDPISPAASDGSINIPVRIRNVSTRPVCGSVVALVGSRSTSDAPTIINGDRRPSGVAAFDYSRAFGDFACLPPGGISNRVIWQIKPAASSPEFFSGDVRFAVK